MVSVVGDDIAHVEDVQGTDHGRAMAGRRSYSYNRAWSVVVAGAALVAAGPDSNLLRSAHDSFHD